MSYSLENKLVVAVSAGALFDLAPEGETETFSPGAGFLLVKALLAMNQAGDGRKRVEVILLSPDGADASTRLFNAARHYGLAISRAAFVSGASPVPYLKAFQTDLFLSTDEQDVQNAVNAGIAAGTLCGNKTGYFCGTPEETAQIRIAFDGDAVLFSDAAEKIYREQGLEAFERHEQQNAMTPLPRGPFAGFLKALSDLQREFAEQAEAGKMPIRTALVTARCAPAHERVVRTLQAWNVRIDETFFLGGISKKEVLKAFGAQIFFDDQELHTEPASEVVPSARVPYRQNKEVDNGKLYEIRQYRKRNLSGKTKPVYRVCEPERTDADSAREEHGQVQGTAYGGG